MPKHENLFHYLATKGEVYSKLQDDYGRDQKFCSRCQIGFVLLCVAAGLVDEDRWRTFLVVGAVLVLVQYLVIFIDNSNRNFLLHAIDWLEERSVNDN